MAKIIRLEILNKKEILDNCLFYYETIIRDILNVKGGETFSFTIINKYTNEIITEYCLNENDYFNTWNKFKNNFFNKNKLWNNKYINFIFYSRQRFELDKFEKIKLDPCLENNRYVWFSGSITNLDEIEKALGKKFTIFSQAVAYYDELLNKNIIIKGIFTALVYDLKLKKHYWLNNGVPIWSERYKCEICGINNSDTNFVTWEGTTDSISSLIPHMSFINIKPDTISPYYINDYSKEKFIQTSIKNLKRNYYILFSGGIDSIISSYTTINNLYEIQTIIKNTKIIFVYFDYGSKASKQEITALKKFYNLIKREFSEFKFEYRIIDIKDFFNAFNNIYSKSININEPYIPYKNTLFAILLSKMIDKDLENEMFSPYVLINSNLSKSYRNLEDSSAWVQAIDYIIMYSGKNYKKIDIINKFENFNRADIIIFAISEYGYDKTKELLDIAYSCVDPNENGEPCGKCENCKLRNESFKEAVKYIKKKFFKNIKKISNVEKFVI